MFRSREEINKLFREHLESLELSGLPFDAASIGAEWQAALDEWDETHR
jgi:hypothetical protein